MVLPGDLGKTRRIAALINGNVAPNKIDWGKISKAADIHLYKFIAKGVSKF